MSIFTDQYLLAMRQAMIFWTTIAVAPWEIVFDGVENELSARGVSF